MPTRQPRLPSAFHLILFFTLLWSLAMAVLLYRHATTLDATIGYGVMPATHSLLTGHGLTICSDTLVQTLGNPICFHSARMPMAEWVLALGIHLFGERLLPIALFKTLLFLMPLYVAIFLALSHAAPARRALTSLLLLIPFSITPFWLDIVSLDFEEAYSYGFIALAFALAIFLYQPVPEPRTQPASLLRHPLASALLAGLTIAAIYLSKSSMIAAAAVLLAACLYVLPGRAARLLALLLALAAPLGWAGYQHHAGGRYTLGTSLDGFNLHMGNSPNFLRDYPPTRSLDDTASQLNAGHHFSSEWAFNDYHQAAAIAFIKSHPSATLHGEIRKLNTILLSTTGVGAWRRYGLSALAETAGLLLFRLLFLAALILSVVHLIRGPALLRWPAAVYLAFIAAAALPYLLGFGYTRHVSVFIYPTVLLCCRMLAPRAT